MQTILIVDDEYALVDTLKDFLEDRGYRVVTANNGREGHAAMKEHRPDLVVTDLMMPLMNGRELLTAMRADPALADVPAILMSSARKQVAVPPGADFPTFSRFLRKPFLLKPFMEAVVDLIGPPSG